jgi:hypothetical protein
LNMRQNRDFYPDLIEKLSRVNHRRIVRVNLSDRYRCSELYETKRPLKKGEPPEDGTKQDFNLDERR